MSDPDFACKVCGIQCDMQPAEGLAVCPKHCEDHDYVYEREFRGHYCKHCGQEAPYDWFHD